MINEKSITFEEFREREALRRADLFPMISGRGTCYTTLPLGDASLGTNFVKRHFDEDLRFYSVLIRKSRERE